MIKIDKSVQIPADGRGTSSIYPWQDMEVGNSFYVGIVDTNLGDVRKLRTRLSAAAVYNARMLKRKYTVRTISDTDGVRVWRLE